MWVINLNYVYSFKISSSHIEKKTAQDYSSVLVSWFQFLGLQKEEKIEITNKIVNDLVSTL